jgi:hypothetical protein
MLRLFFVLLISFFFQSDAHTDDRKKITMYFMRPPEEIFQRYWTDYVQSIYDCNIKIEPLLKNIDDFSIVVVDGMFFQQLPKSNLINHLKKKNLIIFHLGDEAYTTNWSLYQNSFATFREFFKPRKEYEGKVFFLPIATKYDFKTAIPFEDLPKIEKRDFKWSFVGQLDKSNRQYMYNNWIKLGLIHYDHFNSGFNSKDCLSTLDYQQILQRTLLSPCPKGYINDESYRLYESIESGCVPIVERGKENYYESFFGKVPFVVVNDWNQIGFIVEKLLSNETQLENIRKNSYYWWQELKIKKKLELKTKIDALLELKNS